MFRVDERSEHTDEAAQTKEILNVQSSRATGYTTLFSRAG